MPKIDITKITGYEAMTPEQKIAALERKTSSDSTGKRLLWIVRSGSSLHG